jgi:hypothetical protein
MRARLIVVGGTAAFGALLGAVIFACGGDDKTTTEPARQSRKGEACQVSGDCLPGLGCKANPAGGGGTCVVANFNVSVTAKECVLSECSVAADCCNIPTGVNCSMLLMECGDSGPTSVFCQEYQAECACERKDCVNDSCVTKCTSDTDCFGSGLPKCAGGVCVQCGSDTDCGSGSGSMLQCINGRCNSPCMGDGDCPGFQRCVDMKCIESGCQTDRECIAATRDVESTCGTDGKCIVPCQTDLECGDPTNYKFFSCINNQCIYTGCQTDKDCRLALSGPSDASTLPSPKDHLVCRDKAPGTP